ncbi:diaminopimelate decarboxylase [Actinoplanes sp. SE50]|uniref:diaminopimelate decarboxylase n=1 Tax=unclassified Actinoplanes TaxID=2626549 RepID=UPI00023ECBB0|nr:MULTISPECIES: diaminopimelate decarboxylase [unclassified Actinoplanes]AEV87128.1 diaminopimelate decarboxylase [Actinoplanes sp. SE50/110]ATO85526.1 diaminopimelate decarboxylase [Actinoplanes sp. SE50]SLM02939.1 diaminopimelate decarboxylase [Actinoplanes sp. SE50/110]
MNRREFVERFGSPLYVYDLDRVDAALVDLRASVPEQATLFFSQKANPHPAVVERLIAAGCRAEVSSSGELATALGVGADPRECLYTGPGKTASEIANALGSGVRRFSVESEADLERVASVALAHGVTAECIVRINGLSPAGASGLRMTGMPSQFGFDLATSPPDWNRLLATPGARIVGLHFFPLTNAVDQESLFREFAASIDMAAQLRDEHQLALEFLDIGGGFGCPYAQPGERPTFPDLRAQLIEVLDERMRGWRDGRPEVAFESGRYLVGDAGTLLCTVTDVKVSKGKTYAVLDAGINHLGGLSGIGRVLPMARPEVVDGSQGGRPERAVNLVGPLCTSADLIGREVRTAVPEPGDILAIPNVGAYGLTASLMGFLSRPVATEVVVRRGHEPTASRLELRRTSIEEENNDA